MERKKETLEEALDKVTRMAHKYVEKGPYRLFPDQVRVKSVLRGLAENRSHHGQAYCPCRPIEESLVKGRENVCPCTSHHEDIERDGYCECALFVSRDFLENRNPQITESSE